MATSYDSYEMGFSGQLMEEGEIKTIFKFDQVAEWFEQRLEVICEEVGATEAPTIFLTGDRYLYKKHLKKEFVPNFREEIAVTKPYKGTRKQEKPFHFYNLTEYILATQDVVISEGCEADDLMGIEQSKSSDGKIPTIICSRDKDLRMIPGWHYSWECGNQPSIGPIYTDELGMFDESGKIFGLKLFYYQLLAGDVVDNIPGCPKIGEVKARPLIEPCNSEKEMFDVCVAQYKKAFGEDWKTHLKEQANLLWIHRQPGEMYNPKERGLL